MYLTSVALSPCLPSFVDGEAARAPGCLRNECDLIECEAFISEDAMRPFVARGTQTWPGYIVAVVASGVHLLCRAFTACLGRLRGLLEV